MLKTKKIFIDTQTFVANNFFTNANLRRLSEYGELGVIDLCTTEITINEIKSNIKEELLIAQDTINQFKKSISKKGRILKHIKEYKEYIELPILNLKVDYEKIVLELEHFIKVGKVTIIPFELANLNCIVSKYFRREKPFGTGDKKHEFPDAIVLSALEQWCESNDNKIYIVSGDNDMKEYVSNKLLPIPKLRTILDIINRQYKTDRIKWINNIFEQSTEIIRLKIEEYYNNSDNHESYYEITLSNISIDQIIIHDVSIVQDNEEIGETVFQFDFDIFFDTDVEYEHEYESSMDYDKGDDRWVFNEWITTSIHFSGTETAEIAIQADYKESLKKVQSKHFIYCSYCSFPNEDSIRDILEI